MDFEVASARLPTGEIDEKRAIDCVALLIPMVRHKLEKYYSREWLQTALQMGLREGQLPLAIYAVHDADAGDEICDAALRAVGAELQMALLQRRDLAPGHLQIIAYFQRAGQRAPHKHPGGRRWHDNWMRNIQLCQLVHFVCREFDVHPTRGPDTRLRRGRAGDDPPRCANDRTPSGISIVVAALARNGIHLTLINEESVQRNIWLGLPGELVRTIAPTLIFERAYSEADCKAAEQPQGHQLNHLRRRLLNGVSHLPLTLPPGRKL